MVLGTAVCTRTTLLWLSARSLALLFLLHLCIEFLCSIQLQSRSFNNAPSLLFFLTVTPSAMHFIQFLVAFSPFLDHL